MIRKNALENWLRGPPIFKIKFISGYLSLRMVNLVLQPHGITPNFLELYSWSPGAFYSYYIHQGNKLDKERKIVRKSLISCIEKVFIHFCDSVWCNSMYTLRI